MFSRIKIPDCAGKLSLETGSVERRYQLSTAYTSVQIGEIFLYCLAQRVYRAETSYDYSPQTHAQVIYLVCS